MGEEILYGENRLKLQDFLTASANNVNAYLKSQPWSENRKKLFRTALTDLINRGIIGADNSSGTWQIQYNGEQIDLASKSKKELEMYGEAAYYILQQLASLTPIKETPLPKYDYNTFKTEFENQIVKDHFGGREITSDEWNNKDTRDTTTGIIPTTNRRQMLATSLANYLKSLDETKYQFDNLPEFKSRIDEAITALSNTDDVLTLTNAFDRIGLKYSDFLSDGLDDKVRTPDGTETTWRNYITTKQTPLPTIVNTPVQETPVKLNIVNNTFRFYGIGLNGTYNPDKSISYYNELALKNSLTVDLQSELIGLFKRMEATNGLEDISPEEAAQYGTLGANNRLKRIIPGDDGLQPIHGLLWDSELKRIVKLLPAEYQQNGLSARLETDKKEREESRKLRMDTNILLSKLSDLFDYSKMTPEMKLEIDALGFDLLSIVDPEPLTAAGLGITASALRDKANPNQGFWEKFVDYGSGFLSAFPVIGDLGEAIKLGNRISSLMRKSAFFASTFGAIFSAAQLPEAYRSAQRIADGEFSARDVSNIAYALLAILSGKNIIRSVKSMKTADALTGNLQHSVTVKDKNTGKTLKIELTPVEAKQVKEGFSSKKGRKKRSTAEKEALEPIKGKIEEAGFKFEDVKLEGGSKHLNFGNPVKVARSPRPDVEVPRTGLWIGRMSYENAGFNHLLKLPNIGTRIKAGWNYLTKATPKKAVTETPKKAVTETPKTEPMVKTNEPAKTNEPVKTEVLELPHTLQPGEEGLVINLGDELKKSFEAWRAKKKKPTPKEGSYISKDLSFELTKGSKRGTYSGSFTVPQGNVQYTFKDQGVREVQENVISNILGSYEKYKFTPELIKNLRKIFGIYKKGGKL